MQFVFCQIDGFCPHRRFQCIHIGRTAAPPTELFGDRFQIAFCLFRIAFKLIFDFHLRLERARNVRVVYLFERTIGGIFKRAGVINRVRLFVVVSVGRFRDVFIGLGLCRIRPDETCQFVVPYFFCFPWTLVFVGSREYRFCFIRGRRSSLNRRHFVGRSIIGVCRLRFVLFRIGFSLVDGILGYLGGRIFDNGRNGFIDKDGFFGRRIFIFDFRFFVCFGSFALHFYFGLRFFDFFDFFDVANFVRFRLCFLGQFGNCCPFGACLGRFDCFYLGLLDQRICGVRVFDLAASGLGPDRHAFAALNFLTGKRDIVLVNVVLCGTGWACNSHNNLGSCVGSAKRESPIPPVLPMRVSVSKRCATF